MDARNSDPISLPRRGLTDIAVRALVPRAKQYEIRDADVRGLAIRVNRTSKTWVLIGRFGRRHSTRYKLGSYPEVSLKEARAIALQWRASLAAGKDPTAQNRTVQKFGAVAEQYFRDIERRGLRRARETERDLRRDLARFWGVRLRRSRELTFSA